MHDGKEHFEDHSLPDARIPLHEEQGLVAELAGEEVREPRTYCWDVPGSAVRVVAQHGKEERAQRLVIATIAGALTVGGDQRLSPEQQRRVVLMEYAGAQVDYAAWG